MIEKIRETLGPHAPLLDYVAKGIPKSPSTSPARLRRTGSSLHDRAAAGPAQLPVADPNTAAR